MATRFWGSDLSLSLSLSNNSNFLIACENLLIAGENLNFWSVRVDKISASSFPYIPIYSKYSIVVVQELGNLFSACTRKKKDSPISKLRKKGGNGDLPDAAKIFFLFPPSFLPSGKSNGLVLKAAPLFLYSSYIVYRTCREIASFFT